jgi:hypothetical protein
LTKKTLEFPFLVFHEAFTRPDGTNSVDLLHDPNTPKELRDEVRRDFKHSLETVASFVERNTKRGRHAMNHAKRDLVLADMRVDPRGKPQRGEPQRLADKHGISIVRIRKWIEQSRRNPPVTTTARLQWETTDWQTIYYGEALRAQNRSAGRKTKKSKR